jgi:cytochrome c biogenesis protein CcdA
VLAAAAGEHKLGPLALAGGVALSFVAIGMFVATIGFSAGLDAGTFRVLGGLIMIAIGLVLAVPQIEVRFATAAAPISNWTDSRFGGFATAGLTGQFLLGLLLGTVWSPCVGPTLGAASVLASQGKDLGQVALTMIAFGIGAATPLVILGLLSREALMRWRNRLMAAGKRGKMLFGGFLVVLGAMILTGLDKQLEAFLVQASPAWLTELTTRF